MTGCKDCGAKLHQAAEKAIGDGVYAVVWTDETGSWICPETGDEHAPSDEAVRPFEVEFTLTLHVLATDADRAYEIANEQAMHEAAVGAWTNYDDCAREITEAEF